jgi:hypothetical protein
MENPQDPVAPQVSNQPAVTPAFTPDSSSPPKSKMLPIMAGVLAVLLLAASAGAYWYMQPLSQDKRVPPFEPTPTLSVSNNVQEGFSKRLFEVGDNFFPETAFPAELTSLTDDQLVGIQCTDRYQDSGERKFVAYLSQETKLLTDPTLLSFIETHPTASRVTRCETTTGQSIIEYDIEAGGGGSGSVAYFDWISAQGTLIKTVSIPNDGAPYFGCFPPYALTTGNLFYYGCGGGDGGFGQTTLYKIDLNAGSAQLLLRCTSTAESSAEDPNGGSKIECNQTSGAPATLDTIQYTLPAGWTGEIVENSLLITAPGGGFLSIKVYDYTGAKLDLEYCRVRDVCVSGQSTFTAMKVGNVSGVEASGLDNSGGGREFIATKGNKMYVISTFSPPSPSEYEKNVQTVLDSLKF